MPCTCGSYCRGQSQPPLLKRLQLIDGLFDPDDLTRRPTARGPRPPPLAAPSPASPDYQAHPNHCPRLAGSALELLRDDPLRRVCGLLGDDVGVSFDAHPPTRFRRTSQSPCRSPTFSGAWACRRQCQSDCGPTERRAGVRVYGGGGRDWLAWTYSGRSLQFPPSEGLQAREWCSWLRGGPHRWYHPSPPSTSEPGPPRWWRPPPLLLRRKPQTTLPLAPAWALLLPP